MDRRNHQWERAKRIAKKRNKDTYGTLTCEKCGASSDGILREGFFHAHDIIAWCVMKRSEVTVNDDELIDNMCVLCKYCHLVAPNGHDEFKKWIDEKTTPFTPMTQQIMKDIFNTVHPFDDVARNILYSIAMREQEGKTGQICRGIEAGLSNGNSVGMKAPLGYDRADGRFVINDEEEITVRTIFDMSMSGYSYRKICHHLTSIGAKTKSDGLWKPATIMRILDNLFYVGYEHWGGRQWPDKHPAIITMGQYTMAKKAKNKRIRNAQRRGRRDTNSTEPRNSRMPFPGPGRGPRRNFEAEGGVPPPEGVPYPPARTHNFAKNDETDVIL